MNLENRINVENYIKNFIASEWKRIQSLSLFPHDIAKASAEEIANLENSAQKAIYFNSGVDCCLMITLGSTFKTKECMVEYKWNDDKDWSAFLMEKEEFYV